MVVQLYRLKKADVVSRHWWRWTARIAQRLFEIEQPSETFDVWRIP